MSDIYDKLLPYYEQHKDVVSARAGWGITHNRSIWQWIVGSEGCVCILGAVLLGQSSITNHNSMWDQAASILGITEQQAKAIGNGFDAQDCDCYLPNRGEYYEAGVAFCRLAQERATE